MHSKLLLYVICFGAIPRVAFAGVNGSDTVSPGEAKIIVQAAQDFMKDCGDCVAPGFDFKARTVRVNAEDLRQRDKWIKDTLDKYGGQVHDDYQHVLERCEWGAPKITVDVAVVKFWQVNKLAPPLVNVWGSFADTCGNPPNPAVKAFVKKIKTVHFKVAPHWPHDCPDSCGYEFSFDAKTGTLDVGVHNHPVNIDPLTDKWLKQQ